MTLIQYFLQNNLVNIAGSIETNYLINFLNNFNDIQLLLIRFFKILLNMIIVFIKHPLWIIIFLSIFIQIFLLKKIDVNIKYFLICLILNLLIIMGVYISQGNIDFMLRVTLDRVLFQTSGFYFIIFLNILNIKKNLL